MELSRYVQKNNRHYLNTVSLKVLPLESDEDSLRRGNFLVGQELDAIREVILKPPVDLTLQIISTWECNLRCHHCFSHRRLVKKQESEIDIPALTRFLKRYDERYPVKKTINFLGGEPTLKSKHNLRLIEAVRAIGLKGPLRFSISTNLAKDLDDDDFKFLSEMDALQVSVDGTPEEHNEQRRAFLPTVYGVTNPYEQTMANIQRLLERKIKFQVAAAISYERLSIENKVQFFRNMLRAGIPFKHIVYGHYFHTDHAKASPGKEFIVPLVNPCCTFRFMRFMAVEHERDLVIDFYNNDGHAGTLDDDLDSIEAKYLEFVTTKIPALNDPVCMKCEFLGQCWGGCVGATYSKHLPSRVCDAANIAKVRERRDFIVKNVDGWLQTAQEKEKNNDWNANHMQS
jgi:radical SAM protein with 4Fe4S-binding SPASM domain